MGVFGGEHLGFSYGGVRSENLGIVRTIDNRYSYTIAPPIKDITTEVPNYNGVYFWGSNYDRRNITIPFAFDEINETQLSRIKKILNSKKVQELVFDEDPNIIYPAMVANTSTLSFLCFDIMGKRIYRGEGSLNFICHTPYKRCKYKFAEELKEFRGAATLFKNEEGRVPSAKLYVADKDWSLLRELYAEGYNDDLDGTTMGIAPGKIYRLGYSTLPSNK
jgi:predicted phage tail component-like protein